MDNSLSWRQTGNNKRERRENCMNLIEPCNLDVRRYGQLH